MPGPTAQASLWACEIVISKALEAWADAYLHRHQGQAATLCYVWR